MSQDNLDPNDFSDFYLKPKVFKKRKQPKMESWDELELIQYKIKWLGVVCIVALIVICVTSMYDKYIKHQELVLSTSTGCVLSTSEK